MSLKQTFFKLLKQGKREEPLTFAQMLEEHQQSSHLPQLLKDTQRKINNLKFNN